MITVIKGDLLKSDLAVIGHQTNCLGVMGAGIAKAIKAKWPNVFVSYSKLCKNPNTNNRDLLGTCQIVPTPDGRYVANLFGEYSFTESASPFENNRHTDYGALRKAFISFKEQVEALGFKEAGIPYKLGCGLAGGDWDGVVFPMISELFAEDDFKLFIYQLN